MRTFVLSMWWNKKNFNGIASYTLRSFDNECSTWISYWLFKFIMVIRPHIVFRMGDYLLLVPNYCWQQQKVYCFINRTKDEFQPRRIILFHRVHRVFRHCTYYRNHCLLHQVFLFMNVDLLQVEFHPPGTDNSTWSLVEFTSSYRLFHPSGTGSPT